MTKRIIFDGTSLFYFNIREGRGTELWLRQVAYGLRDEGYDVHIVAFDGPEEMADGISWWNRKWHPTKADLIIHMNAWVDWEKWDGREIVMLTSIDKVWAENDWSKVEKVICISPFQAKVVQEHCAVPKEKIQIISLMVDRELYVLSSALMEAKRHGGKEALTEVAHRERMRIVKHRNRFLYCSSPDRGLRHIVDIWPLLKREIPRAELHITYGVTRQFENKKWLADATAQWAWEIRDWLKEVGDVTVLEDLSRDEMIREQLEASYLLFPCDPVDIYTQFHSLAILESMAAGMLPFITDVKGLPEIFNQGIVSIPLPVDPETWALTIANVHKKRAIRAKLQQDANELVERHTTDALIPKWLKLVEETLGKEDIQVPEAAPVAVAP